MSSRATISRSIDVEAPADQVWALISDLPRMGDLSPENTGGSWVGSATEAAVGARFRGANRRGWRRWSTSVEVTTCEPGRRFVFDVSSLGLAVARWSYDVVPRSDAACTVTESWADHRGRLMDAIGMLATGVSDRSGYTVQSIDHTLARVKAQAETG